MGRGGIITVRLERNGKYWLARWKDPLRPTRRSGRTIGLQSDLSQRAASVVCQRIQLELNTTQAAQGPKAKLGQLIDQFLENHPDYSKATVALYESTRRCLAGTIKTKSGRAVHQFTLETPIEKITPAMADDWQAAFLRGELEYEGKRKDKPSANLVRMMIRNTKTIFNWAVRKRRMLPWNPFDALESTSLDPDKDWAEITDETMIELLNNCPSVGWQLLLALCRWAGLRQAEALRLKWAQVDLKARRFRVVNQRDRQTTKDRMRDVPIDARLFDILSEASKADDLGELVIPPTSMPPKNQLRGNFNRICKKAGLEIWAKWCHTLRKNCETEWIAEHPIDAVCQWLGNSPTVALRNYTRARPDDYRRASGLATNAQRQGLNKGTSSYPITNWGSSSAGRATAF